VIATTQPNQTRRQITSPREPEGALLTDARSESQQEDSHRPQLL